MNTINPYRFQPALPEPLHWWDLDNLTTGITDKGKGASFPNALTNFGTSIVAGSGPNGQDALQFGSGDYLKYATDQAWDGDGDSFTAACWVKSSSISSSGNWLMNWRSNSTNPKFFQLVVANAFLDSNTNELFRGDMWDASDLIGTITVDIPQVILNQWHHVVTTFNESTKEYKLYVDGDLLGTSIFSGFNELNTGVSPFAIGNGAWGTNSNLQHIGEICMCGMWDTALTPSNVQHLYAQGKGRQYKNLGMSKPGFNTFGRASRKFDGTDAVIVGDVLDEDVFTKDSWSISFWVKRDTEDSIQFIFDKLGASLHSPPENQRQFGCSLRSAADDYRLSFAWYGSLQTSSYRVHRTTSQVRVSDGWSHFTISYNKYDPVIGNRIKIYRDGVEDVELWLSGGNPSQIPNGTARLAFGASVGSDGSDNTTSPLLPLTGSLADIRLYDKVLSSNEANLLSNGNPVNDQLVGHWLINQDDLKDHAVSTLNNEIPSFSTDGPLPGNYSFGDTSRVFDNVTSGTRKIVRIEDFPEMPTGAQTWTAWVKLDARDNNGNGQDLFGQWDYISNQKGAILYIPATGKPNFFIGDNSNNAINTESPIALNPNVWYHIAGTYDPSNSLKIYVNGSLSQTNTSSIPSVIKDSSVDIEIGSRDSVNDLFLAGKIADCRIYDADIGASAIAGLAVGTEYRTNLVGQWLTNSDDLLDHSGNNHHAYLLHNEVVKHHGENIESPEFSIEGPLPNNKTFGKNSLKFNGLNDYVDLEGTAGSYNFIHNDKVFAVSCWAKLDDYTAQTAQVIIGANPASSKVGFTMYYENRSQLGAEYVQGIAVSINHGSSGNNDVLRVPNVIFDNDWHHYAATGDGTTIKCYVDGVLQTTTEPVTYTGNYGDAEGDYYIGATNYYVDPFFLLPFKGNLADCRIYDTDIGASAIAGLADGIHFEDNLVGWWGVNEKSLRNFANAYRSKYSTDSPFIDTSNFASRHFNPTGTGPAGNEEHVAIPNNSDIPKGEQTWSVWAKLNVNSTAGQSLVGQWGDSGNFSFIIYHVSNQLSVIISENGSTTLSSGTFAFGSTLIGDWQHIAFTFIPNTSLNLYVNGVLEKTVATTISSLHASTADLRFGRMDRTYNASFSGSLSDVRMYDADIGAGVIASLANGEDYRTNLKGQWLTQFNNLLDYAGTNDGINNGSTFSNDNPFATELDFASRSFDGIDDYIDLGDSNSFSFGDGVNDSPFSVSAWIKMKEVTKFRILMKEGGFREWQMTTDSAGRFCFFVADNSNNALRGRKYSLPLSTNIWYNLSMTYDGRGGPSPQDGISLYVNGSRVDDIDYTDANTYVSMENTSQSIEIGRYLNGSDYSDGNIADVRIYDTVISDIAILNLSQGIGYDQTNLVGRWLTNSDDVDDYAGTNHGTNYGSIYSKGANPFNQIGITSRTLDGVDDYVSIPDIDESTTNLSVALWLKTTDVDWVTTHLAHWKNTNNNRAWFLGPSRTAESNGKKLMVYLSGDGDGLDPIKRYYGTTDVSDGAWHHVAFTWGNGTLKLFVDGSEETTTKVIDNTMTSIHNSDGPITVGCTWVNDAPANFGSGGRADIRIYNSTLSASNIADLYNGGDVQTGLAGHWLTNNNDDVDDYAGTNHGTNYGSSFNFENYNIRPIKFGVASRMFDGEDDQMSIPDINENVNNLTVLFWLKTTESHWEKGLFSHWDINNNQRSWIFTLSNNSATDGKRLSIVTSSDGLGASKRYYGGSVVSDGTWHHCGMTWDNGILKLFVDGVEETVLKASNSAHGSLFNSSGKIAINGSKNVDTPMFLTKASMADCRIYNTTLSEGEILSIKSGKDNILNKNSLVGHWLTNVDSFNDFSGNGNHALPAISDGSFGGSQYSAQGPAS